METGIIISILPMIALIIGILLVVISFILSIIKVSKRLADTLGSIGSLVIVLSFLFYFIVEIVKLSEYGKEFEKNNRICTSAGYSEASQLKDKENIWVCIEGDKIINIKELDNFI